MAGGETRKKVIGYCLTFPGAFEDYPFGDPNWTVMRHKDSRKAFAFIYERDRNIWVNLKCDPFEGDFLRSVYPSVTPGYHMNKVHWLTVIMDGSVPEEEVRRMITDSYALTGMKKGKRMQ